MKKISSVGLFILCFFANYCHSVGNKVESKDTVINLKYSYKTQIVINPGRFDLFTMQDSTFLSYYKDGIVMKLPLYETDMKMINTDSGMEFTNVGQPEKTRFRYVSFKKGDSIGSFYGINALGPHTKISADSVWKKRISFPEEVITKNVDSLIRFEESSGFRTEYYVAEVKPGQSYPDSIILNFSDKLNEIPFSFSEDLDTSRKMKLYKIQYIYKPYFDKEVNGNIPRREFKFEIALTESDEFATKLLKDKN